MPAPLHAHNLTGWPQFIAELDAWAASGRRAQLWWRDDDATKPGPALDRLFAVAGEIPLALAVIPTGATRGLVDVTGDHPGVTVLQHGFAHTNHAPTGEKKSEFGAHRPLPTMLAEIAAGRERLSGLFGDCFCPVFVPPWNRIAKSVAAELGSCGLTALSVFGPADPDTRPRQINCHIDIVNWHGGRGFLGVDAVLNSFASLLSDIRHGARGSGEAIGLLTHHRDHDDAGWQFLEDLTSVTRDHPGACWTPVTGGLTDR